MPDFQSFSKITLSAQTRYLIGIIAIAFIGSFFGNADVVEWISHHKLVNAIITALGVAFHTYNTFANPKAPNGE